MNVAREIAKLRRTDSAGRMVTLQEFEALLSLLRAARDGIISRHGCGQALSILSAMVEE